jgi:anti-sigma B factor antagonist
MLEPAPHGASAAGSEDTGEPLGTTVVRPRAGTAVLAVEGEVDTLTAPQLEAALSALLDDPDPVLVVDLGGVTFLASSGLAVLIRAAHRAEAGGRRLRLVASSRAVRRPLEITGADELFDVHDDLGAATAD